MENTATYTLVILKPECIENCIVGPVMQFFDAIGLRPVAMKLVTPSSAQISVHYYDVIKRVSEDVSEDAANDIVKRMTRGDCIFIIYMSKIGNAVTGARSVVGTTDPKKAAEGTIRNRFGGSVQYNVAHASDSIESADREIRIWFPEVTFANVTAHAAPTTNTQPYEYNNHCGC